MTGLRAFQSPFLLTSDAVLDRATSDPRLTLPLLRSLAGLDVTGLALASTGVRYLFSVRDPLSTPRAFAGARIRIEASLTGEDILRRLRARPTMALPGGRAVVDALRDGRLDAVEADMRSATRNRYVAAAPYIGPLFAEVTTLVAGTDRLRELGPEAAGWIRAAATRAATVQRAADDRASWATACRAGLEPAPSTPAQLDALHAAVLDVHAGLDGDSTAALAIDRMGLMAVRERVTDAWARCGPGAAARRRCSTAPTRSPSASRTRHGRGGSPETPGRSGSRSVTAATPSSIAGPADPEWPNWDFSRDPVEVGTVLVHGDEVLFRPETAIRVGSRPATLPLRVLPRPRPVAPCERRSGGASSTLPIRLAQGQLTGRRITIRVPPPGGLSIVSSPPTPRHGLAVPARPPPEGSAPPGPSSVTAGREPAVVEMRRRARSGPVPACLSALASASEAQYHALPATRAGDRRVDADVGGGSGAAGELDEGALEAVRAELLRELAAHRGVERVPVPSRSADAAASSRSRTGGATRTAASSSAAASASSAPGPAWTSAAKRSRSRVAADTSRRRDAASWSAWAAASAASPSLTTASRTACSTASRRRGSSSAPGSWTSAAAIPSRRWPRS